jgi:hypothetical protein
MLDVDRPKFRLSEQQGDRKDELTELVEAHIQDPEAQPFDEDRVDESTTSHINRLKLDTRYSIKRTNTREIYNIRG